MTISNDLDTHCHIEKQFNQNKRMILLLTYCWDWSCNYLNVHQISAKSMNVKVLILKCIGNIMQRENSYLAHDIQDGPDLNNPLA